MRILISLLIFAVLASGQARRPAPDGGANLPAQVIGPNDLLSVSVYDAPELTRTVRVGADGYIRLPMVKQRIKAEGVRPADVELAIAEALKQEEILVEPYVTVSIAEYQSRPIVVTGAVKMPVTFQAEGPVTLLEALARAQGLREDAGPEILVTMGQGGDGERQAALARRIPVRGLIDNADPELNLKLTGGEEIRVPEVGKIYVLGNVKKPNAYKVQDGSGISILQLLALAEGLAPYANKEAYIYRKEASGGKAEIMVPLEKILKRKEPDMALQPNDIFYVPDNRRRRIGLTALEKIVQFGTTSAATALIYGTIY